MAQQLSDDKETLAIRAGEYERARDFDAAIKINQQRTETFPKDPVAWRDLGSAFNKAMRFDAALSATEEAIRLNPKDPVAHAHLAVISRNLGDIDQALESAKKALELDPEIAPHHVLMAELLLARGDFKQGFREYEYRLMIPGVFAPATQAGVPLWRGEHIKGDILLAAEQGFGDTIQYARYARMVAERAENVTMIVQPELKPLLASLDGVRVSAFGEPAHGNFFAAANIASMPCLFGTTIETIPSEPYLRPADDTLKRWQNIIKGDGFRVGIAWRGNDQGGHDRGRSMAIETLGALADISNVSYYALQKDASEDELAGWPNDPLTPLGPQLDTFDDTAAAIANLDLVITTDTAVAHVAGAIGQPVWLMLKCWPAWRWMLNGDTTPWYPSMRLFRQQDDGDWDRVIKDVAALLSEQVG